MLTGLFNMLSSVLQSQGLERVFNFGVLGVIAYFAINFAVKKLPQLLTKSDFGKFTDEMKECITRISRSIKDEEADIAKLKEVVVPFLESQKHTLEKIADIVAEINVTRDNELSTVQSITHEIADIKKQINELLRTTDKLLYAFQYALDPKSLIERFKG